MAVARSCATRVLVRRSHEFCAQYPWIDLYLDGMRHVSDLHRGEADADAAECGNSQAYYFCATERAVHRPMVKAFRDWLLDLAQRPAVRGAF